MGLIHMIIPVRRVNVSRVSFDFFNALIYHNYHFVCIYIPIFLYLYVSAVLRVFSIYGNLAQITIIKGRMRFNIFIYLLKKLLISPFFNLLFLII